MLPPALAHRFIPELRRVPGLTPQAARAHWKALHMLGLGFATRLTLLRSDPEPLSKAHGEIEELSLVIATLWELVAVLRERLERIPDKRRPQYTPSGRFRALRAGRVLKLAPAELAALLAVSEGTVFRWQGEMNRAEDDTRSIGKTVRPTPPLTRYADVVEHLAQALTFAGLSGQRMIASTLARAGYLVSRSTVRRRLLKPASVPPEPAPRAKPRLPRVVKAKHPNHVWMADLTLVRGLFGLRKTSSDALRQSCSSTPRIGHTARFEGPHRSRSTPGPNLRVGPQSARRSPRPATPQPSTASTYGTSTARNDCRSSLARRSSRTDRHCRAGAPPRVPPGIQGDVRPSLVIRAANTRQSPFAAPCRPRNRASGDRSSRRNRRSKSH